MPPKLKLYGYADEAFEVGHGRSFWVGLFFMAAADRLSIREELAVLEATCQKRTRSWNDSTVPVRLAYLVGLVPILAGRAWLFGVSVPTGSAEAERCTAEAAQRAIGRLKDLTTFDETILTIDALSKVAGERVARLLREAGIRVRVRGARSRSDVGLRVADSIAGLIRGADLGRVYTVEPMKQLRTVGLFEMI